MSPKFLFLLAIISLLACEQPDKPTAPDMGEIVEGTYFNKTLNWSFEIPAGYDVIPNEKADYYHEKGMELVDKEPNKKRKYRLLSITNDTVSMIVHVNLRSDYPKLIKVEDYFEVISKQVTQSRGKGVTVKEISRGSHSISDLKFEEIVFEMTNPKTDKSLNVIMLTRIGREYILDFSFVSKDEIRFDNFLGQLKKSRLDWEKNDL